MCFSAVLLACLAGAVQAGVPFDRYRVILDRAPFGAIASPTQMVASLKHLRLSALMHLPDGPRAGFVDEQGKNDFVLRLNEKSEGAVELLAVDYPRERVTIRYEGQLLMLGLQPGDISVVSAVAQLMGNGANEPSALHPAPPPLPENLSPELRTILMPVPPPPPHTPEGRRFQMQMDQLLNPTLPADAANIALPMPGGLSQPQVQSADPAQDTQQTSPAAPRRGNRHGGFGN